MRGLLTALSFIAFACQVTFYGPHWPSFALGILLGGCFVMLRIDSHVRKIKASLKEERDINAHLHNAMTNGGVKHGHSTHEQH